MTEENYKNLTVGTEIYYTGDQANSPGEGEIVDVDDGLYTIKITNLDGYSKTFKYVEPVQFRSIGRRFRLMSEWVAERNRKIIQFNKNNNKNYDNQIR